MKDILFLLAGIGVGFAIAKVFNTEGGKKLLNSGDACQKQNTIVGFKPPTHVF